MALTCRATHRPTVRFRFAEQKFKPWYQPEHPPNKEDSSEEEIQDIEMETQQGPLIPLSEAAAVFLETSFNKKLDNKSQVAKAKVNDISDSWWIRCAQLDPVVSANISKSGWQSDQISLQLKGNANYQHSMDHRNALMMKLNPKLKKLISHKILSMCTPSVWGEFWSHTWKLRKPSKRPCSLNGVSRKASSREQVAGVAASKAAKGGVKGSKPKATEPRKGSHST